MLVGQSGRALPSSNGAVAALKQVLLRPLSPGPIGGSGVHRAFFFLGCWGGVPDGLRACLRSLGYVKLRLLPRQGNHVSFLSQRHRPGAIRPDSSLFGIGPGDGPSPRTVDLYDVFCGVLYLLKSGCQWRMLPADFPDWRTCYKYFRQWSERPGPEKESILEQVLKKIGWRGPAKQWPDRADQLLHRGLPERKEH